MRNIIYSILVFLIILLTSYFLNTQKNLEDSIVFEKETNYYTARVVDSVMPNTAKARILFLDFDSHSIEYKDKEKEPVMYTSVYPIFGLIKKDGISKINVIGGGAYTLPKYFADEYKGSSVTVLEVDKEVSGIAEKYFDIDGRNIKTVNEDARTYFNRNNIKYDIIFGDAYNSFISVPWHLTTYEFLKDIKKSLNKNGVYAVNFISSIKGDSSVFFNSMVKTFSSVFPNYYIFAFGGDLNSVQNIVLVGINNNKLDETTLSLRKVLLDSPKTSKFAQLIVDKNEIDTSESMVFRDDFAPVEKMMVPVMKKYFSGYLAFYNFILKQ